MGINHSRLHIFVPHQLLDSPDVVSGLKQMRYKRMEKSVAADTKRRPRGAAFATLRPRRRLGNGEHAREPSLMASNVRVRPQQEIYTAAAGRAREKVCQKAKNGHKLHNQSTAKVRIGGTFAGLD